MSLCIALVGNPTQGFDAYGPYQDFDAAAEEHVGPDVWIMTLEGGYDLGFRFDIYESHRDGVPVVHVETPAEWDGDIGPRCRIYLNDEELYANPPKPDPELKS